MSKKGDRSLGSVRVKVTASRPKASGGDVKKGGPSGQAKDTLGLQPNLGVLLVLLATVALVCIAGSLYIPGLSQILAGLNIGSLELGAQPVMRATGVPTRLASPQPGVDVTIFSDPAAGEQGQILLEVSVPNLFSDAYAAEAKLYEAVVDFTGQRRAGRRSVDTLHSEDLEPYNRDNEAGDYVLKDIAFIPEPGEYQGDVGMGAIFVPKQPFHTTLVRVKLGVLDVGVLRDQDPDTSAWVEIYRQVNDVTGQPIGSGDRAIAAQYTDDRGLATFVLAEGFYVMDVEDVILSDVDVKANGRNREIVEIDR